MALIYPSSSDEELSEAQLKDPEAAYADFASDWSDTWVVEVQADHGDHEGEDDEDDGDAPVVIGPMGPREAWDLASELDDRRPEWVFAVVPVFPPEDPDTLIARLESDD